MTVRYLSVVGMLLSLFMVVGVVLPFLFSQSSDIAVAIGIAIVVLFPWLLAIWLLKLLNAFKNKNMFEQKEEK